ncbi:uncharacterized protein EI90DRAFT_3079324 [Cantharellus anzutake]|uniref:uncharacterized protein n=1 Tax=Cantharellus anzutake TaxID=1750568 RepID=UPI00190563F7|nr:uncharacterized protein EI90DRAFT_3079324 [Cantharellus anzutake]KAF8321415.1 hypothetical protein EI90DRAFT_3079324 [Cantharellus anzutake]
MPTPHTSGFPVEIDDMEKTHESDLRPSQNGIHENSPETLGLSKLHWWTTIPLGLVFIFIAAGSEVVLERTRHGLGFDIYLTDTELSRGRQFLKSFLPSILFTPLFLWFTTSYGAIRLLKPYIGTEKDRDEYEKNSPGSAVLLSFRKHHWVVFILSCIAISGGIFHSLAGSYFQIIPTSHQQAARVRIAGKTAQGYDNLTNSYIPFVDAAGFVGTVRQIGALYSPFIFDDTTGKTGNFWVVPSLTPTDSSASAQGGNVSITFKGLSVQAKCAPVPSPVISGPDSAKLYHISGSLPHNCSATSYASPDGTTWYSWMVDAPIGCVRGIDPGNNYTLPSDPVYFSPVAFSFFKNISSYSMVFCYSMIEEHDVSVKLALNDDIPSIYDVVDLGNVSFLSWGPSGTGWTNPDPRVEGIKDAIRFALADSIVKHVGLDEVGGGMNTSEQDRILRDGASVVGYAEDAIILFQATVAPSTLVVGPPYLETATQYVQTFGLVAIAPVAHVMTAMCAIVGLMLIALFIHHYIWREGSLTSAAPSASTTAPALAS